MKNLPLLIAISISISISKLYPQFNIDCQSVNNSIIISFNDGIPPYTIEFNGIQVSDIYNQSYTIDNLFCGTYLVSSYDYSNSISECVSTIEFYSEYTLNFCVNEFVYIPALSTCFNIEHPCYFWEASENFILSDPSLPYVQFTALSNFDLFLTITDGLGNISSEITYVITTEDNPMCDVDNDGVQNSIDNCIDLFNPDQLDFDNDGIGDLCDEPNDDKDGDGIIDDLDPCPEFYENYDFDGDGICDNIDNCLDLYNPDQLDSDNDGIGDLCDLVFNEEDQQDTPCSPEFIFKEINNPNPEGIIIKDKLVLCEDGNGNPIENITIVVENNFTDWEWSWDQGTLTEGLDYIDNTLFIDAFGLFTVTGVDENDCVVSQSIEIVSENYQPNIIAAFLANGYSEIDVTILQNQGQCAKKANNIVDLTNSAFISYKARSFCLYDMAVNISGILNEDGPVSDSYIADSFCGNGLSFREFIDKSDQGQNVSMYLLKTKVNEGKLYVKISSNSLTYSEGACDIFLIHNELVQAGKYITIRDNLKSFTNNELSSIRAANVFASGITYYRQYSGATYMEAIDQYEQITDYLSDCIQSLINLEGNCELVPQSCWNQTNFPLEVAFGSGFVNAFFQDTKSVLEVIRFTFNLANNPWNLNDDQKKLLVQAATLIYAVSQYISSPQIYIDYINFLNEYVAWVYGDGELPLPENQLEFFECLFSDWNENVITQDRECAYHKGESAYLIMGFAQGAKGFFSKGNFNEAGILLKNKLNEFKNSLNEASQLLVDLNYSEHLHVDWVSNLNFIKKYQDGLINPKACEVNIHFNSPNRYNLEYIESLSAAEDKYPFLINDLYMDTPDCTNNCNALFQTHEKLLEIEKTGDLDMSYEIIQDNFDVEVVENVINTVNDDPPPRSNFFVNINNGRHFENNVVKPIFISTNGVRTSPEYLQLKLNVESIFGVNIDDYSVYDQVQLIYEIINGKEKYFVADFLLIKRSVNTDLIEDVIVIESKLRETTRPTTNQNQANRLPSGYIVRSNNKSAFDTAPGQVSILEKNSIIETYNHNTNQQQWIIIYDNGDGLEINNSKRF